MESGELSAAAQAFDAAADSFDQRFGDWLSVAAQRRAVRAALAAAFPAGAHILEVGGGTGDDALWLTRRHRHVLLTDASPRMVRRARHKLRAEPLAQTAVIAAERLDQLVRHRMQSGAPPFDGAFSNFAALNCVTDLAPVARGLSELVRPGGSVVLVVFGAFPPGEVIVQCVRGNWRAAFRRLARGDVAARLGGRAFAVRYHRAHDIVGAMAPQFRLVRRRAIGVFVPPSAAEPWISGHPHALRILEALDRVAARPLAALGDHVLYHFRRTETDPR
jgi:SAM-dependent methyltransferase